jgi:hypothetical protein
MRACRRNRRNLECPVGFQREAWYNSGVQSPGFGARMMKRIINFLQERATGRTVLILVVVTLGVYAAMLLYTIPSVLEHAPDMNLFDMSPGGYSLEYAGSLLDAIGADGRQTYLTRQLPMDFVYPGLFAVTYTLLLTWLFNKGFSQRSPIFYLALVPAVAGLFDYLENVGIIMMLRSFPNISAATVAYASVCSVIKSVFTTGFFILLLVGIAALAIRRIGARD